MDSQHHVVCRQHQGTQHRRGSEHRASRRHLTGQGNVQFCEKNWVRRISGVERADKRRMEKLRVEVGVKESFKKKLVKSRLIWTGRVERMGDGKLAKRADAQKVDGKGGDESKHCDGKTALRVVWKEQEKN